MQPALASQTNRQLIYRLLRENFPSQWKRYAVAIVAMIVIAATTAFSAYIIGTVTDELIINSDGQAMIALAGVVLLIFFVKGVATYVQTERLARVGNAIVAFQQRRIYERVLGREPRRHEHARLRRARGAHHAERQRRARRASISSSPPPSATCSPWWGSSA